MLIFGRMTRGGCARAPELDEGGQRFMRQLRQERNLCRTKPQKYQARRGGIFFHQIARLLSSRTMSLLTELGAGVVGHFYKDFVPDRAEFGMGRASGFGYVKLAENWRGTFGVRDLRFVRRKGFPTSSRPEICAGHRLCRVAVPGPDALHRLFLPQVHRRIGARDDAGL